MFSKISTSRPLRAVAGIVVAGGLALGLSACSPATNHYYAASDGTRVALPSNSLEVVNLMILTSDSGKAVMVGAVHSNSAEDNTATIAATDGSVNVTVDVPANDTVNLYTDGSPVEFTNFAPKAGSTVEAAFSDTQGDTATIFIPVFDGDLPEYKDYLPTAQG
ncbi:hypothetical protein [Timonella senegalensis]|uniref:hypothetical protein n=1 Tax=Timonella senegalensis TaxID=1465825 RepID=UPI0028A75C03|nr:hypothetical protein [Timonella senegalensis]